MSPARRLVLALASAVLVGSALANQHAWGADPLAGDASQLDEVVPKPDEEDPANKTVIWPSNTRWCQCVGNECGCCFNMSAPRFGIKNKACSNLTYYPDQYALGFSISIDDNVVLNRTVSGRDPPPICWPEQIAQLCVRFYNMTYHRAEVDGCIRLEAVVAHEVIVSYNVGCYVLDDDAVRTRISGLRRFLVDAIRRRARPDLWPEGINEIDGSSEG